MHPSIISGAVQIPASTSSCKTVSRRLANAIASIENSAEEAEKRGERYNPSKL